MKLLTCLAHADLGKRFFLQKVLEMQKLLFEEVHVCICTNMTDPAEIALLASIFPAQSTGFKIEIVNRDYQSLPSGWLLTWAHKALMFEKFQDPTFTHFMCIEDDMEVTPINIKYWTEAREHLRPYGLYPSFLRTEWDVSARQWSWTDSMRGDVFSIQTMPRLDLMRGYGYINLPRPYQGMFLYDRELMQEHIESDSFSLEKCFPKWREAILHTVWPLGLTEAANLALTHTRVPAGCISRNFLPYYPKYNLLDPRCFVHHLPDKYANAPDTDIGKVLLQDLLID